ncbi:MAG: AMP-binding protein, partial [Psychromonas sp.]
PIKANPNYIFAAIEKYQCSNLFANPALIEVIGQAGQANNIKLNSLKRVISAGAPATLPSIARFTTLLNANVEILNSYGATESLPISKVGSEQLLLTEAITNTGGGICVGKPVDGLSISIIEITENIIEHWQENLSLPAYEIGEIVVNGPQVSRSYYHRNEATKEAKIKYGESILHRMGDLGYLDEDGQLWMCGRKAHRVDSTHLQSFKTFYSIPSERIINTHTAVKRSALVNVKLNAKQTPLICIELNDAQQIDKQQLFEELRTLCEGNEYTSGITDFLIHKSFPMDIRHNAKIFREKLAIWAQSNL